MHLQPEFPILREEPVVYGLLLIFASMYQNVFLVFNINTMADPIDGAKVNSRPKQNPELLLDRDLELNVLLSS